MCPGLQCKAWQHLENQKYTYAKSFGFFPHGGCRVTPKTVSSVVQLSAAKDVLPHSCLVSDSFSLQGTGALPHALPTRYTASFAIAVLYDPRSREHWQMCVRSYHSGQSSVRGFFISFPPGHFCTVQAHEGRVNPNLQS